MQDNALVPVAFDGDTIETLPEGGRVWIGVRGISDSFGIDASTQIAKLKGTAWATVGLKPMVAEDGKTREVFCLDLEGLPMWLATIDAGRVNEDARPKLIRYQREAARVLREHFFGPLCPPSPAPALPQALVDEGARMFDQAAAALRTGDLDAARRLQGAAYMLTRAPRQPRAPRPPRLRSEPHPTVDYEARVLATVRKAGAKGLVGGIKAIVLSTTGNHTELWHAAAALITKGLLVRTVDPDRRAWISAPTAEGAVLQ